MTNAIKSMTNPNLIATAIYRLLRPHLVNPDGAAFWVWQRSDRAIVSINPGNVKNIDQVLSDRFAHHLSTTLGGVRVRKTNTRGIFYQIGYEPIPSIKKLSVLPLDLSQQPGPLWIPIGDTQTGPLWLDLLKLDAVLIGGARRMGKTRVLHGVIQALIQGDACRLYLWDGKNGNEFDRYAPTNSPLKGGVGGGLIVIPANGLDDALAEIRVEVSGRAKLFGQVGAVSLPEYNRLPAVDQLPPLVLILDEVADLTPNQADTLTHLVRQAGAYGVHPIIGIQRPDAQSLPGQLRANLPTRISLAVAKSEDSRIVLGSGGAEKLPKEPGWMLINHGARLIKARSFRVDLPGAPAASGASQLTRDELALARRAHTETAGRLSIPILTRWGMTEHHARTLLDDWQTRGRLVASPDNARHRVLSPMVLDAISQTHQTPQTDLKATSNPSQAPQTQPQRPQTRLAAFMAAGDDE